MQTPISTNVKNFEKILSLLADERENIKQKFGELYKNVLSNIEILNSKSKKITQTDTVNSLQNDNSVINLLYNQFLFYNKIGDLHQTIYRDINHKKSILSKLLNRNENRNSSYDDQTRIIYKALINNEVRNHPELRETNKKKNINKNRPRYTKSYPDYFIPKARKKDRSKNDFSRHQVVDQHSSSLAEVLKNVRQASAQPHREFQRFRILRTGLFISTILNIQDTQGFVNSNRINNTEGFKNEEILDCEKTINKELTLEKYAEERIIQDDGNTISAWGKSASSELYLSEPEIFINVSRNINEIDHYNKSKNSSKSRSPSKVQASSDSKNIPKIMPSLNLSESERSINASRNINEIDHYNKSKNSFKSRSPSKVQGSSDLKNILNILACFRKQFSLKKSKEKNAADENSILKSKNDLKDLFKCEKKIKKSENFRSKSLEFLESKAISLKLSKGKTMKNRFKTFPSIKSPDLSFIPLTKPPHHDSYAKNNYLEEKGFFIKPKTKLKKKSIITKKENEMLIKPITIFTPETLQENVTIESFDNSKKLPISDYHLSKFPKPSSNLPNKCYEFDKDALMSMFSKLNHVKEIDMKKINFSKIVKNLSRIFDSPIKGLWNINVIQMKKIIESKASDEFNKVVLKYIEKVLIEMYLHEFYSSLKELIIFSRYLDSIVVYFSFIYIDYCSEKSSVKKNLIRKLISFLQGGENKAPNLMKSKNFSVYNYFKEILFNVFL